MAQHCVSDTAEETEAIGQAFASSLTTPCVVAFTGDLGAGKTTFIRGMCKGVDYTGEVSSPTFAIVHEYLGGRIPLYHFDMYRIQSAEDLYACGFYEYLGNGILAIEWSENIWDLLPADTLVVRLAYGQNEHQRIITIERMDAV